MGLAQPQFARGQRFADALAASFVAAQDATTAVVVAAAGPDVDLVDGAVAVSFGKVVRCCQVLRFAGWESPVPR